jgi:8-oxo-dGTP diphosphatase
VLSRTCLAVYSRVPIFGYLRAAVAIIRKDDLLLVIDRSDGRGFSFPGGLLWPWENSKQAMKREVLEETGLLVEQSRLLFEYRTSADILCIIAVFEAEAGGGLKDSWEGSPRWLAPDQIQPSLLPSQKEIIDRISDLH